jgi:transcriptional regulator with XRE-family HTH domain/tetratricopeptide (TPR) repeat protein
VGSDSNMGTSESYTFSELLKQFRVRSGLSQEELGKKLSVHRNTISAWERGLNLPETRGMVLELAKALDLEAGDEDADQLLKCALFDVPSPVCNVPYTRNSFFTGREEILRRLYETLIMTKKAALTQAISGLGGVGKTQIAVEYAYLQRDEYRAVLWVRADSRESFTLDFIALAHLLHLPEKNAQDQITIVGSVKNWLSTHNKWLLIFDNADNAKMISEFLPPAGNGHVLLTTQALAQGPSAQSIEVSYMGLTDGTLFLLRRAKALPPETPLDQTSATERTAAEEIVQILGGLPLALDQAAAYIEETGCGISDYLDRFRTQHDKLLQRRGRLVIDHPESVTATFLLSFEKVKQVNPAAAQLLKLCAFLYPDAIPEELISEGTHKLDPGLQALAGDHFALDEAMEALRSYSLIRRNPSTKIVFIHRLVQEVLRDSMDMKEQRQWAERVVRTLHRVFPDPEKIEAWPLCQRYLPQAQACVNLINRWGLKIWEGTQLLNQVGYYLQHAHALYSEAEALYALALSIDILTFGPEHPKVSLLLNNLAEIYRIQGKYSQAEPLYHQSLALRAQHLGTTTLA